jgi:capsular polysaccharide transport system permease protein
VSKAREALLEFRNRINVIDPVSSAKSIGETIAQLTRDKVLLENNRAALVGIVSADSPTRRLLDAQIAAIESQIAGLQKQLAGHVQDSVISTQIAAYEDLQLEAQFAEKLYAIAQSGYEKARVEAEKQQLFLAMIVRPTLPEQATYPRIIRYTLTIFAICFVLWSMMVLLLAAIREHVS